MDTHEPSPQDAPPPMPPPYVPPTGAAGGEPPTAEGPALDAGGDGQPRPKHPAKRTRVAIAAAAAGALVGLVGATAIGAAVDGTSGGDAVADREPTSDGFPGGDLQDRDADRFGGRSSDDGDRFSDDGSSDDGDGGSERDGPPAPPQWGDASGSAVPGGQSDSVAPSTRSGAS